MCWSSHRELRRYWDARRQVERQRTRPDRDVRVSDADREAVISQLSRHTGDGRLTLDEFEARVDEVLQAKTERELRHTLRELPTSSRGAYRTRTRVPADIGRALTPVLVAVLAVAVVVLAVPWMLWFVIPFAWCRIAGARFPHHTYSRHDDDRDDNGHELGQSEDEPLTLV